jgi:hypothetical protein
MIREKARDGKEAAMTELFCEGKAAVGVGRPVRRCMQLTKYGVEASG